MRSFEVILGGSNLLKSWKRLDAIADLGKIESSRAAVGARGIVFAEAAAKLSCFMMSILQKSLLLLSGTTTENIFGYLLKSTNNVH